MTTPLGTWTQFSAQLAVWAQRLAEGDGRALGCLFDAVAPRLLRYALTLTHQANDAEDAVQAAFLRLATRPAVLAQARAPWPYLLQVVRNEGLKILQRRPTWSHLSSHCEPTRSDLPDLEQQEAAALVRQALQHLPPEQAEVVVLKIWEGMTFAEIAEVVEESPNTVASRYRYGLQKLAVSLEPVEREVCCD